MSSPEAHVVHHGELLLVELKVHEELEAAIQRHHNQRLQKLSATCVILDRTMRDLVEHWREALCSLQLIQLHPLLSYVFKPLLMKLSHHLTNNNTESERER